MLNNFLDKYIFTGSLKYVHNNFSLVGIPFMMVPTGLLDSLVQKQDLNFDKEIYYFFKAEMVELLEKRFGVNFKLEGENGVLLVQELFSAFGWGGIKQIDLDSQKKRAIVVVNNSPIAINFSGKAKFPVDHFLRGILAGLFTNFFKEPVECVEVKCYVLNQSKCEFIVKRKSEFDFSKEFAKRQLDTDK